MRPAHLLGTRTNQERLSDLFRVDWNPALDTNTLLNLNPAEFDYATVAQAILKRWQPAPTETSQAVAELSTKIPGYETVGSAFSSLASMVPEVVTHYASPVKKYIEAKYNEMDPDEARSDWFDYCRKNRVGITPSLWKALNFTFSDLDYFLRAEPTLFSSLIDNPAWHPLLVEFMTLYPTVTQSIVDALFGFFSPFYLSSSFLRDKEDAQVTCRLSLINLINQIAGIAVDLDKRIYELDAKFWDQIKEGYGDRILRIKKWSSQLMGIPKSLNQTQVGFMMYQWSALREDEAKQYVANDYFDYALLPYLTRFSSRMTGDTRCKIVEIFWKKKQRIPLATWNKLGYTTADIEAVFRTIPEFFEDCLNNHTPEAREMTNLFMSQSQVYADHAYKQCLKNIFATAVNAPDQCRIWIALSLDMVKTVPQLRAAKDYSQNIIRLWFQLLSLPEAHEIAEAFFHRVLMPHLDEVRVQNVDLYHTLHRGILSEAYQHDVVLSEETLKNFHYDKNDLIWMFTTLPSAVEGWLRNEGTMWFELLKSFSKKELEQYRIAYLTACYRDDHPITLRLWQMLQFDVNDVEWMFQHIPDVYKRLTGESALLWHENLIMMAKQSPENAQVIEDYLCRQWAPTLRGFPQLDDPTIQLLARVLETTGSCSEEILDNLMTQYFSRANRQSYAIFEQTFLPYCQTHQAALSVAFKTRWVAQLLETKQLRLADPLIEAFKVDEIDTIRPEQKYALWKQHNAEEPKTPLRGILKEKDVTSLMKARVQADVPPSRDELQVFHQMSPQSYFDVAKEPDVDAIELERLDVLLPLYHAFPEETDDHVLPDDVVRQLLLRHKKPVDSTRQYHTPIITEYEAFKKACDEAFNGRVRKTRLLKEFILSNPVSSVRWLDLLPEQNKNQFEECLPWLAVAVKPRVERLYDPLKLQKIRDDKTYFSYCCVYNKSRQTQDPYEKALNVLKDYANPLKLVFRHWGRHHAIQVRKFLKAEVLLPNKKKTPEELMERFNAWMGGKTLKSDGSLNRRKEFLETQTPKHN